MKKGFIFLLIAILLAGCASAVQSTTTSKGPVDTQSTPTTGAVSTPTSNQGEPVIVMEKSGGIAGIHNQWSIYANGQVVSNGQVVKTVTADEMKSLLADIQKSGFFDMQSDYSKDSTCNDCFVITLTVNSGGNSKAVTGVEGDANTPAEFLQVASEINSLVTP